ncbi:hypothetical protein NL364_29820, partial [Klebsiella pneumoniae]|nr:hypothetical protein [Klebsiella pneumoniae]
MVALVRTTDEGERMVCYLPKPPAKSLAKKTEPKKQPVSPEKPKVELDTDALIATITAKVIE